MRHRHVQLRRSHSLLAAITCKHAHSTIACIFVCATDTHTYWWNWLFAGSKRVDRWSYLTQYYNVAQLWCPKTWLSSAANDSIWVGKSICIAELVSLLYEYTADWHTPVAQAQGSHTYIRPFHIVSWTHTHTRKHIMCSAEEAKSCYSALVMNAHIVRGSSAMNNGGYCTMFTAPHTISDKNVS